MAMGSDNFKAGLFVIVGGIGAFVAVVLLADIGSLFQPTQEVTVRYPVVNGLRGLKEGAVVTLGDHPVGSVKSIVDEVDAEGNTTGKAMIVTFTLPQKYKLYDNAIVELDVPPLGAGTELNIRSVGHPVAEQDEYPGYIVQGNRLINVDKQGNPIVPLDLRPLFSADQIKAQGEYVTIDPRGRIKAGPSWDLEPGESLRGGIAATPIAVDLVQELGVGDVQKAQIQTIIKNFAALSTRLSSLGEAVAGDADLASLPERSQQIAEMVKSLNHLTHALGGDKPDDELTDRALRISRAVANLTEALEDTRAMVKTGRTFMNENEQKLVDAVDAARDSLRRLRDITRRVQDQTLSRVDTILGKADTALDNVRVATKEFKHLAVTQRPVLEKTLADVALSADQFKLATIEIRRAPWKLLYTPSKEEYEIEAVYESARSFAAAANTLDRTAASMRAMLDQHGDQIDPDDPKVKLMLDNLHQTFESFHKAEQGFWDAVGDRR